MKRSIINIAIITATLTTLTVSAQAEARKGRHKAPEVVFAKLDADQSNTITIDELLANVDAKAQKKLDRADTNTSSEIELDEYLSKKRHSIDLSEFASDIVQCVQDTKDATGNSNIIVPDVTKFAAPETKFAQLDTDNSGGISLAEITAALTSHETDVFSMMDADSSGDITLEEFIQQGERKRATKDTVKACIESIVPTNDPL
ncbi:hypothetical protein PA25_10030 [Pseudoalteromonas sp. A25]|uniref:EF-hand domain-containing protein n=1 Tax=Pseudoalteromonas sp. A25 TaxID=116092 RepID=UPI001260D51B|nr:EF-hand domain-containing protein [Pseudoalteromonas sp. A25]BBN81018.1 hypothetical protein PA25_10030 [Pseudoalteromonas sp. A25]